MTINVEERAQRARKLFESGYNCAQSVAITYSDQSLTDPQIIEKATLAFGGGLGRQREVCGTVSGASMILGIMESNIGGAQTKSRAYKMIQELSRQFSTENGSIVCRELLALGLGEDSGSEPSARTEQYYKRRPCAHYVECSARILGQIINDHYLDSEK